MRPQDERWTLSFGQDSVSFNSIHEQGLGVNAPAGNGMPGRDGLFIESR